MTHGRRNLAKGGEAPARARVRHARTRGLLRAAVAALAIVLSAGSASAWAASTGQPGFYTLEDQPLGDDLTASVNVANGNLLVAAQDLAPADATYNVVLGRVYNSQGSSAQGALGPRWQWDAGPEVRLHISDAAVTVDGPTGERYTLPTSGANTWSDDDYDGTVARSDPGTR